MKERPKDQCQDAENPFDLAAFRQVPANAGVALDQLSAALAGMLSAGDDPYSAPPSEIAPAGGPVLDDEQAEAPDELDRSEINPRSILEALLFVGSPLNEPLEARQVASLMRGVRPAEIDTLVRELNELYERRNCPYTIVAEAAGYRLALREEYGRVRDQFYGRTRQARLSQAAIEVLAAVAYHGPISSEDINRLRGTPSGSILTQLVRRGLLRLDRDDAKPRRIQYSTTKRFLELFGLENLNELPRSNNLEGA